MSPVLDTAPRDEALREEVSAAPRAVVIRRSVYAALVGTSGFAALLYENVWQRVLHNVFGTTTEASAVIVSVFMLGLGVGALAGGLYASSRQPRLLLAFALCELVVAVLGATSLATTRLVGEWVVAGGLLATAAGTALVLLVPTIGMGASLPLLATYAIRYDGLAGRALARFYFVNTLGAALACVACVGVLYEVLGLTGTVRVAAVLNVVVAVSCAALVGRRP